MYQQRIRSLLNALWVQIIFLTLVLLLARYFMFYDFVNPQQIIGYNSDVHRMWWTGLRFDLRATTILLLPLLFVGLLLSIGYKGWRWLIHLALPYSGIVTFVVVSTSIISRPCKIRNFLI
jgi:hypothetical protein